MTKLRFIYFSLLLILFSDCASTDIADSKDVAQDKIYMQLSVEADLDANFFEAEAIYRFGGSTGTTLRISEPGYVSINGQKHLEGESTFRGFVYSYNLLNEAEEVEFSYVDLKGNTYTNTARLPVIRQVNIRDTISKSLGCEFTWEGEPYDSDESFIIRFYNNEGVTNDIKTAVKNKNLMGVSTESLSELQPGLYSFRLIRKKNVKIKNRHNMGGNLSLTYAGKKIQVQILP